VLALLAVLAVQGPTPEAARAESLLAAGALREARALTERLVARSPRDPKVHLLLGRIWLAWPVIGRYQALAEFRTAARLAPHDPEPLYGQVQVGFHLGSDEGEIMAREALLAIFALDPDYRDSWTRFQQLFRNDQIVRRADRALARHPRHLLALERRAELAIALRESARADSLAALLLARGGARASAFLLRAEAAFLDGRDDAGQAWHDSAVANAVRDSSESLWERAWTIASPEEAARYAAAGLPERRGFFQQFWAVRDPNLLTPVNERLGEHVRRMAEARHRYRLLHPFRMVYRSRTARALAWFEQRRRLGELAATAPQVVTGGAARLDFQSMQDLAHTRAVRAGLDARGLTYVRYGPPDLRVPCAIDPRFPLDVPGCTSGLDVEGWLYRTPAGVLSLGFVRAEFYQPASAEQLAHTEYALRSDASSVPAPAGVRAWTAFFRSTEPDATDTYLRAEGDSAAFALWSPDGEERGRVRGSGVLGMAVPPGPYRFGLDVDSAGVPGRLRDQLSIPGFAPGELLLSSLVLAVDSTPGSRLETLRGMPPDLAYTAGAPLAAYVEVYGLGAIDGQVRYRARYSFAPERSFVGRLLRGTEPVSFEFERRAPADGTVVDRVVIEPGLVPPGRYRVTLAVTDLATNVKSETVALVVTLR
jgi:hypothetical protein